MTSGTVSSSLLALLFLSCSPALAQQQAQFNQVLNINGDMQLNSFTFPDRSKIETFSQKQQQLIVNQNTPAVPPNQVTGSTGQPFVAMSAQSMSINTNGAQSLVGGQIELAIDPQMLQNNAVNPDNTFVAMLSPDRQSWMIQETMRSVNVTDMTVRMVKRANLDGEYMALGRQTVETNAFLTPFGSDSATQVAIQGTGLQENEFQDGFRMSTRATQPMTMNVDVKEGIDQGMLAGLQGQQPVNDFRYSVVTNLAAVVPDLNQQVTVVQMPIPVTRLQQMMQQAGVQPNGQVALAVAQRGVQQNPGGATGNLGGAATGGAPAAQRRASGRADFRKSVAERQVQGGTTGTTGTTGSTQQGGTPTTGNNPNPVASQLLLQPTFTPIQADAVIDPLNMRIAIPVRQVDGEYLLTMQVGGAAPQPQAAEPQGQQQGQQEGQQQGQQQGQQEGQQQGQQEGQQQGQQEGQQQGQQQGQEPQAQPEASATPSNGTQPAAAEGQPKPERRQEKDANGEEKPPQGSIFITMKEVNKMAELLQWGGQAPISQMMTDYVKSQTGGNGTQTE